MRPTLRAKKEVGSLGLQTSVWQHQLQQPNSNSPVLSPAAPQNELPRLCGGKHHGEAFCPASQMREDSGPFCTAQPQLSGQRQYGQCLHSCFELVAEGSYLLQQHNATGSATHCADPGLTRFCPATVGASRSPSPKTSERTQGDPKESRGLSIFVGRKRDPNLSTPEHCGPTPSQSSRAHLRWEVGCRSGSRSSSCRRECGSGHGSTNRFPDICTRR